MNFFHEILGLLCSTIFLETMCSKKPIEETPTKQSGMKYIHTFEAIQRGLGIHGPPSIFETTNHIRALHMWNQHGMGNQKWNLCDQFGDKANIIYAHLLYIPALDHPFSNKHGYLRLLRPKIDCKTTKIGGSEIQEATYCYGFHIENKAVEIGKFSLVKTPKIGHYYVFNISNGKRKLLAVLKIKFSYKEFNEAIQQGQLQVSNLSESSPKSEIGTTSTSDGIEEVSLPLAS